MSGTPLDVRTSRYDAPGRAVLALLEDSPLDTELKVPWDGCDLDGDCEDDIVESPTPIPRPIPGPTGNNRSFSGDDDEGSSSDPGTFVDNLERIRGTCGRGGKTKFA